jgi:hypothetical protein
MPLSHYDAMPVSGAIKPVLSLALKGRGGGIGAAIEAAGGASRRATQGS